MNFAGTQLQQQQQHQHTNVSDDAGEVVRVDRLDHGVIKQIILGVIGGTFITHFPPVDGFVLAVLAPRSFPPLLLLLLLLRFRRRRVAAVVFPVFGVGFAVLQTMRRLLRVVLRRRIIARSGRGS